MNYVEIYSDNIREIVCEECLKTHFDISLSIENIQPDYDSKVSIVAFKRFDIYNNHRNHIYRVRYNRCRECLTEYINIEKYGMHYGNLLQRNVPISQLTKDEIFLLLNRISEFDIELSNSQEEAKHTNKYFVEQRNKRERRKLREKLENLKNTQEDFLTWFEALEDI